MLDVRKLRLLRELDRLGTIAAVAEALSYTPSAVSQQLAALERETGRKLLNRTGRRVSLTPTASVLVDHTERVLAELERAEAALAADTAGTASTVRLGAFPTALCTVVLPAMTDLGRTHPDLAMSVVEVDPADVPDLLRGGDLDVALVHEYDNVPSIAGPGVELEPLLDEVVYLATTTAPRDSADLTVVREHADSRWIAGNPGTLCHTMTLRTCQSQGFEPRVAHRVDDFGAVLDLVAAGGGVALVPQLGTIDVPAAVTLTALPLHRRTRIACRQGSRSRPAFAAVSAALRHAVRDFAHG